MSLFDSIQYPLILDGNGCLGNRADIPNKFFYKLYMTSIFKSHSLDIELLREIILTWDSIDDEKYTRATFDAYNPIMQNILK